MTNTTNEKSKISLFGIIVYAIQMFFGGWFLLHGANHFVEIFIQPPGSSGPARDLITALISSGLFDLIKALEVFSGVLLLANRFVPLGIATAFPTALVIGYVNVFMNTDVFGMVVAVVIIAFNTIMVIGLFQYFRPLLRYKTEFPSSEGLKSYFKELSGK